MHPYYNGVWGIRIKPFIEKNVGFLSKIQSIIQNDVVLVS